MQIANAIEEKTGKTKIYHKSQKTRKNRIEIKPNMRNGAAIEESTDKLKP